MGFNERIEAAMKFEKRLFEQLEKLGFRVAMNGTEHTHPDFVSGLRGSEDQTSLAIRFQPDGVASFGNVPRSFYVEAKAGIAVERTAWDQYSRLRAAGNLLVIVFAGYKAGWNFSDCIELIDGTVTVSKYSPWKRFPVVDGWVTPRGSDRHRELRGCGVNASFTPYREVDPSSLHPWSGFREKLNARLLEA